MADGSTSTLTNPVTGTGASGQVAFWNGTSSQTGDNGLFWNNTNKRLGIGTVNPGFPLDVVGQSRFSSNINLGTTDNSNGVRIVFNNSSLGRNFQIANNFNVGNALEITPSTTVNGATFTTPALAINGGSSNIGIGTTTDAGFRLDVNGTARVQGAATFSSSVTVQNGNTLTLLQSGNGNGSNIRSVTSGDFRITTGGTPDALTITNGGNVGIGTASPEAILHVNKITAGGEGGYIYIDNPASSTLNSSVGIRFSTSTGGSFAGVYTGNIANIVTNASDGASALTFGTFDGSTSAERMRITSGGDVNIKNGTITTGVQVSIAALNTDYILTPRPYSGLIVIRDNTNGGSGVWLADPNQGFIQIANNMPGAFTLSWSSPNTVIRKTSGNTISISVAFYSNMFF
jgi:hypothetical protein